MRILRLGFENYRNLNKGYITPSDGVNIIYGNNAQGKTNLLESIWLFTGGRSFRGAKDNDLIKFREKSAKIEMAFYSEEREQSAEITIAAGKRTAKLNGVQKPSASALIGNFCGIIFSPVHLSLIKDGPAERRKFVDAAICQIKPSYTSLLAGYNHTLSQRNTLLKDIPYHRELMDTLDIWEDKLATYGAYIVYERRKYTESLKKYSSEIYSGISDGKEKMTLEYVSSFCDDDCDNIKSIAEAMKKKLYGTRKEDIFAGYTSVGPHRDDLSVKIDGKSARLFGSQGQQRSCVLALKLSEATILKDKIGEKPIVLLDDVMSELDNSRQDYILNCINGWQVFITCCEPSTVTRLIEGKKIRVENGSCSQEDF